MKATSDEVKFDLPKKESDDQAFEMLQKNLYRDQLMRDYTIKKGSKFNPFNIEPFHFDRERLSGAYGEEDRKLRKQYLQDLTLSNREPVFVEGAYPVNFFRKAYMKPFHAVVNLLEPFFGPKFGEFGRHSFHKYFFIAAFSLYVYYKHIYLEKDWTHRFRGLTFMQYQVPIRYPDSFDPAIINKHGDDFYDEGFKSRTFQVENTETSTMISTPVKKK